MEIEKKNVNNIYIKDSYYNKNFNNYNLIKFNTHKIIKITYNTPSIRLSGLYFKIPLCYLSNIIKDKDDLDFKLVISIPKININNKIINILEDINQYNIDFFEKYHYKLKPKFNKSNKYTKNKNHNDLNSSIKQNPLIKKFTYKNFISNTTNTNMITITINIKYQYIIKLLNLIKINLINTVNNLNIYTIHNDNNILNFINKKINTLSNILDLINLEMSDFKSLYINESLELFDFNNFKKNNNENINNNDNNNNNMDNLTLWIKSNNFNTNKHNIIMNWSLCEYKYN
jgi:hypothetical protein